MRCHIEQLHPNSGLCLSQALCKKILNLSTVLEITVLPAAHGSPGTEALHIPSGISMPAGVALFSVANHTGFKSKTCTVSGF